VEDLHLKVKLAVKKDKCVKDNNFYSRCIPSGVVKIHNLKRSLSTTTSKKTKTSKSTTKKTTKSKTTKSKTTKTTKTKTTTTKKTTTKKSTTTKKNYYH